MVSLRQWRVCVLDGSYTGLTYIAGVMHTDMTIFNGLGMHMSNDLAHKILEHPFTPSVDICRSDERFERLVGG